MCVTQDSWVLDAPAMGAHCGTTRFSWHCRLARRLDFGEFLFYEVRRMRAKRRGRADTGLGERRNRYESYTPTLTLRYTTKPLCPVNKNCAHAQYRTGAMQDLGYEFPRIPVLRTRVNTVVRSLDLLLPVDLDEQHPRFEQRHQDREDHARHEPVQTSQPAGQHGDACDHQR